MTAKKNARSGHRTGKAFSVSDDLIELCRHIADFWSNGARGWGPPQATESLLRIDFQKIVDLAEAMPMWYSGKRSGDGHLLLAWVALGAIAEGTLQWFLSVYATNYLNDPIFRRNTPEVPILPEDLFFSKLIAYFDKHVWSGQGGTSNQESKSKMTHLLHVLREKRNAVHCRKIDLGEWEDWRSCLREFVVILCELEGRVPYPDEHYAYPMAVAEIKARYASCFGCDAGHKKGDQ